MYVLKFSEPCGDFEITRVIFVNIKQTNKWVWLFEVMLGA